MFRQQSFNNMIIIVATTLAAVAGFVSADSSSARIIRPASSNSNKYSGNYYRPTGVVHQSTYDNSDNYYDINGQFAEGESSIDQILDKNFEAPPVATATTGGLPFISYALRGIAWLFVVGTLFLMFVGTVSAAFYRWTKAVASGRGGGGMVDLDTTEFVLKAIESWNHINL